MEDEDVDLDKEVSSVRMKINDINNNFCEFEVVSDEHSKDESIRKNFFYDKSLFEALKQGVSLSTEEAALGLNDDSDLEPFEKLALEMKALTNCAGVLKKVLKMGVGSDLTTGTTIRFHYSSYLEYGDEPMDSTFFRNKANKAKLGSGEVFPGLDIALSSMRLKEVAQFLIKPKYAFGKYGCPPRIPPNATLLYEVRIEEALDSAAADDVDAGEWTWERHNSATFKERLEAARAYHRKGNSYYASENLGRARRCYQRGIMLMVHSPLKDEQEETTCFTLQCKLLANLSKVYLDLDEPTKACVQCRQALELPFDIPKPMKAKIVFRFGCAKALLNSFDEARRYFIQAQKLKPNCADIAKHLERLAVKQKQYSAQERFLYKKMFAQPDATKDKVRNSSARNVGTGEDVDKVKASLQVIADDAKENLSNSTISANKDENSKCLDSEDKGEEKLGTVFNKISPDFVEIVSSQLKRLTLNAHLKEVMFPSYLSKEELTFVAAEACNRGYKLEFVHRDSQRYPKVVRD